MSQETNHSPITQAQGSQMSDDDVLAYTRGLRVNIITKLMPGPEVPGDNSDRITLTNMIEGLDRQAMGSKKLKQEQNTANNSAQVMSEILRQLDRNTAFRNNVIDVVAETVEPKVIPSDIENINALPGELDVAPPQLDYNSFVRSQGNDPDQIGKEIKHAEADEDDMP